MTVNQSESRRGTPSTAPTSDTQEDQDETARSIARRSTTGDDASSVAFDELLDLLGDEYVADILQTLSGSEMAARDIAEDCGMSRPTVYRRLDRLTEAGVVASRLRPESEGHHRQEFRLILEEIAVQFREDGFDGRVRVRESATD